MLRASFAPSVIYSFGIDEAARREQEKLAGKTEDAQKLFNAV